jgi:hypothetical protein
MEISQFSGMPTLATLRETSDLFRDPTLEGRKRAQRVIESVHFQVRGSVNHTRFIGEAIASCETHTYLA